MLILRFEGPPNSGRTTAALERLRFEGVPGNSDEESTNQHTLLLTAPELCFGEGNIDAELARGGADRQPVGDSLENIQRALHGCGERNARALIVEDARFIFGLPGAVEIFGVIRECAAEEGLSHLIFEDAEPSPAHDTAALGIWSTPPLDWLRDAPSFTMPTVNPLGIAQHLQLAIMDVVNPAVTLRFSQTPALVEQAGYRLGPAFSLAVRAARFRWEACNADPARATVTTEDTVAALLTLLRRNHREHMQLIRGPLGRNPLALDYVKIVAEHAKTGGIAPVAETFKSLLVSRRPDLCPVGPPASSTLANLARNLVDQGVLWLGGGKRVVADALLGVRLQNEALHAQAAAAETEQIRAMQARAANRLSGAK